ncbi:hypothetical protein A2W24_00410 [Microgenomates group bacterium RBG_16_45_19]|nr:MAG: hypothetical protein A2W24_00410 [Microgenomates group bacterium RBG_16_45_19]
MTRLSLLIALISFSFVFGLFLPHVINAQVSCTDPPEFKGPFSVLFSDPNKHCSFNHTQDPEGAAYQNYITHAQVTCASNQWLTNEMIQGRPPDLTGGHGTANSSGDSQYLKNFTLSKNLEEKYFQQNSPANKRLTASDSWYDPASFVAACIYLGYDNYTDCAAFFQEQINVEGDTTFPNFMRTGNPTEDLSTYPMRYTEIKRICDDIVIPCANRGQARLPEEWCAHVYYLNESTSNLDLCQKLPDTYEEAVEEMSPEDLKLVWGIQLLKTLLPGYVVFAPNESLTNLFGCVYIDPNLSVRFDNLKGSITRFWFPGLASAANEGAKLEMQLMLMPEDSEEELDRIWQDLNQPFDLNTNTCNLIKPECISNLNDSPDYPWVIARINSFSPCISSNSCPGPQSVQPSGAGFEPPGGLGASLFGLIAEVLSGPRFVGDQAIPLYGAWFVVPGETKKIDLMTYDSDLAQNKAFWMPDVFPTLPVEQQVATSFTSRGTDHAQNEFVTSSPDDEDEDQTVEEAEAAGGSQERQPVLFDGANPPALNRLESNNLLFTWWDRDYKDKTCYLDDLLDKSPPLSAYFINAIAEEVGALGDRQWCAQPLQTTPSPEPPRRPVPTTAPPTIPSVAPGGDFSLCNQILPAQQYLDISRGPDGLSNTGDDWPPPTSTNQLTWDLDPHDTSCTLDYDTDLWALCFARMRVGGHGTQAFDNFMSDWQQLQNLAVQAGLNPALVMALAAHESAFGAISRDYLGARGGGSMASQIQQLANTLNTVGGDLEQLLCRWKVGYGTCPPFPSNFPDGIRLWLDIFTPTLPANCQP